MNKELEALDIIKRNDFLEQENKELREKYIAYKEELEKLRMLYNGNLQKLSKLEIVKRKGVNIDFFNLVVSGKISLEEYNESCITCNALTEEEFNLLKEVFGN